MHEIYVFGNIETYYSIPVVTWFFVCFLLYILHRGLFLSWNHST